MKRKLLIISLVFAILCMVCPVFTAAETANGSLTLWCVKDEHIIEGMHWQIYRVGYRSGDDYVFTGDFANYRVTLGDRTKPMLEWDTETVAKAAETLKAYTIVDKIPYLEAGETDRAGKITFSGLSDGLYLVCGKILYQGEYTYVPSSIFFEMRGEEEAHLNAYPKIIFRTLTDEDADYTVKKVWQNDENQPWLRSTTITADVYRDGELFTELELNEGNNWTATWTDNQIHEYIVIEKDIPAGYTVQYENNFWQYLIVNTYGDEVPPEHTTTTTQTTTGDSTTTTTTSSSTDKSTTSTDKTTTTTGRTGNTTTVTTGGTTQIVTTATKPNQTAAITTDKLPQTGQTWWPVFPLALGGMVMIGAGFLLRRKNEEDEA